MEVVVEDRQLSLAIGKKGQNVRLAAKLTGWKIDIKSDEDKRKEVEAAARRHRLRRRPARPSRPLALPDIHDEVVAALRAAGYDTVEKVLEADARAAGGAAGLRRRDDRRRASRPREAERAASASAPPKPSAPPTDAPAASEAEADGGAESGG